MSKALKVMIGVILFALIAIAKFGDNVGKGTVKIGDNIATSVKDNPAQLFDYANKSRAVWPLFNEMKADKIIVIESIVDKGIEIYDRESPYKFHLVEQKSRGYMKMYINGKFIEKSNLTNDSVIERELVISDEVIKLIDKLTIENEGVNIIVRTEIKVDSPKEIKNLKSFSIHVLPIDYYQQQEEAISRDLKAILEKTFNSKHVYLESKSIKAPEYNCDVDNEKMICKFTNEEMMIAAYIWN